MAEMLEGSGDLESTTVGIFRTAAVVKGGRRFSFSALVVVGDRRGRVGVGYGKAHGVPSAIEKAQKEARKAMFRVVLQEGTIPHAVEAKFGASMVRLVPAAPGTGVIAGGTVRAVLEMAGVRDCLSKAFGSTNQKNLVKAALTGLRALRTRQTVAELRGLDLGTSETEEKLAKGAKYAPKAQDGGSKARGPVNKVSDRKPGGARRGRRMDDSAPHAAPAAAAPVAEAAPPAAEPASPPAAPAQ